MNIYKKVISIFNLNKTLASLGIENKFSREMMAAVNLWDGLYRAQSRLSIPAAIASETARLVTVEFKSQVSGSERAEFLDSQYKKFCEKLRWAVEFACVRGGVVFKPYIENGEIRVSVIGAENFVPTGFNSSGEITGAAFLDRYYEAGKVYTRIEQHFFEDGQYVIRNTAYVSENPNVLGRVTTLKSVAAWGELEPKTVITGIKRPLFSYFKMPMANFIDSESPLGVSVFAKSVPLINDAETQYKRMLWEFESGERALYVDEAALRRGKKNDELFPEKRLYRLLNTGDDTLFKDWSPSFRDVSIINGLNEILRKIEFNSGFAYGTLSDVMNEDRTAEEVRVSKQRSYAHICDIQNSLKNALCDLVSVMNILADLYELTGPGEYSVSFEFDDSTVADRKTEFEEKLTLLREGVIKPWEMRSWYFGEDEVRAKKMSNESIKAGDKGGADK